MRSVSSVYYLFLLFLAPGQDHKNNNKIEIINWVPVWAPSLHNCIDKSAREHYILQQPAQTKTVRTHQDQGSGGAWGRPCCWWSPRDSSSMLCSSWSRSCYGVSGGLVGLQICRWMFPWCSLMFPDVPWCLLSDLFQHQSVVYPRYQLPLCGSDRSDRPLQDLWRLVGTVWFCEEQCQSGPGLARRFPWVK